MIIQNFDELANTPRKKDALEILEAGLDAAMPENILPDFFSQNKIMVGEKSHRIEDYSKVYTIAFGKAADSMTRATNSIINITSGIIVIPKGSKSVIQGKKFQIINSGHPKPDQDSIKAAKSVIKFLQNRRNGELVIFLVSGGGSALLAMPDGITLSDKIHVTDLLLRAGATIHEFNCVRKHLSKIKGGRLVEELKCDAVALVMSDVQGDDLSTIASGTTYYDKTTFSDALNVIHKYNISRKVPVDVMQRLRDGAAGKTSETPKKILVQNYIIANNSLCLVEMRKTAEKLGYKVKTLEVFGNVKDEAEKLVSIIPDRQKMCVIFGGETTTEVIGKGNGGRNQELVLRLLKKIKTDGKVIMASMGTDGIDGNTKFAGAIIENIRVDQTEIKEFLKNSDSSTFFQKHGGLIKTGYTHTNLMDIGLVLR